MPVSTFGKIVLKHLSVNVLNKIIVVTYDDRTLIRVDNCRYSSLSPRESYEVTERKPNL